MCVYISVQTCFIENDDISKKKRINRNKRTLKKKKSASSSSPDSSTECVSIMMVYTQIPATD